MRLPTLFLPLALLCLPTGTVPAGTPARPNVVVIISDDGGFADWEFMDGYIQTLNPGQAGSPVPTPNLNTLRDRGVLFTNAYTASVCSPSRAAIVTGSYQQRIGYEYNINNLSGATAIDGLHPDVVTIFERMKSEGYTTGAIGKWHIGARAPDAGLGNRPENQGVDEFFGIWKGSRSYTVGSTTGVGQLRETIANPFRDTVLETTAPWNTTSDYVTNAFGQGAVAFIDRHYADPDPFFLYVAFTSPHGPIGPSPDINDPRIASITDTKRKDYASMVLTMDKEVGNILAKIDDPAGDGSVSLTDNTLIIYINDNGGAQGIGTINTPLNNWKGSTYEGGNRVPMLIAGPGIPSNQTTPIDFDAPVHSIDILPTCVEAAGGTPITGIDGVNLIPHLDGSNPDDPHEFITIRNGSKVGVRWGDWKLTKNTTGNTFDLYNLATDIGESTDLSGANPAVVEALLREFTRFEAGCDKPRHAGLNNNADSINLNDRFILNPQPSGGVTFTPDGLTLVGGATLNGNFNAGGGTGVETYDQTPDWTNIGTGTGGDNATNTTLNADGSRNAIVAESAARAFGLDTGHTLATGEIFRATYQWRDASGWNDANDRVRISLFTTADNTLAGVRTTIQSIDSSLSQSDSAYQDEAAVFDPIPPTENGKRLFIEINAAQTGSGFARLDDFVLERGTISGGSGTTALDWSDANIWKDADTNSNDTLLTLDAFPGAVLEFPVRDTFSYSATNDMARMSGLEFLLNQLRLTGTFAGTSPQTATVGGNALMFTNDLNGNAPTIGIAADGPEFSYRIETDLILYDDLTIAGNGTAAVEITGTIRDYHGPRGINKQGNSTVLLSATHSYAGTTTITGGILLLNTGAVLQNSSVVVEANGTLGGNGTVNGNISGPGAVAPGQSIGTLATSGNAAPGSLIIEIDGTASDLLTVAGTLNLTGSTLTIAPLVGGVTETASIIATYGTLTGTFDTITNLPPGYSIDYAYNDGATSTNIALIEDPYTAWTTSSGLNGPDAAFDADPNGDGIDNGLAFFFGAANPIDDASHLAPVAVVRNDHLEFSFLRTDTAAALNYDVEYSTNLIEWDTAVHGTAGVFIVATDNGPIDIITAHLPTDLAFDPTTDNLFLCVRLAVKE